ncbi:hypothetical protein BD779DRAFT_428733 [Infundibulicybe gibba]|nr:hypothetical protein BD779DRAFT_428733 [Infundibulicybe gibba]
MKLLLMLASILFSAILSNAAAVYIDTGGGRILPHPLSLGPGLVIPTNSDADRSSVPRSLHLPLEPGPVILPGPDTSAALIPSILGDSRRISVSKRSVDPADSGHSPLGFTFDSKISAIPECPGRPP